MQTLNLETLVCYMTSIYSSDTPNVLSIYRLTALSKLKDSNSLCVNLLIEIHLWSLE